MKILVNCYACSPYKGSEPGMGWNFVKCLSHFHELHIITESKFQPDLNRYFKEHPEEISFYHFYFIEKKRHKKLRKIWPPSYYWFYRIWQKKALILAKTLDKKENFDIIHQLNMVGYREPGYLYKIKKPLVWGPMGGFNITPWRLLPSMGIYGALFYGFRNLINLYQMHFSKRVKKAINQSKMVICATGDDADIVQKLWNKKSIIIPEVGFVPITQSTTIMRRTDKLKICWSGLHIPRKSLNLLLEALAICPLKKEIELHVIGEGNCTIKWKKLSQKLQLKNVFWHGWLTRNKALEIMQNSHLFVITSLSDATSTVLLEALSLGLPVVTLNHLGFSNVVNNDCGIKININTKQQVITDLAQAIKKLCQNETERIRLAQGALKRSADFTWEEKAILINNIYQEIIH